jgi:hypothetical protein
VSDDPWDRDQIAELKKDYVVIDGVTLPGVFSRDIAVQYDEDPKSEWPIRLSIHFYLDELTVDKDVEKYVEFTTRLKGPLELEEDDEEDEGTPEK